MRLYKHIYKTITFLFLLQLNLYSSDYLWPIDINEALTAVYGDIRPFRYHTGIDVRTYGINGMDVYSIEDGYVSRIAVSTAGYGKVIYIKMKDGNTSVYAHLDRFNDKMELIKEQLQNDCSCYSFDHYFEENQYPVSRGEIIGYTGDTGGLSGPHLHFEIRNKNQEPFNPLLTNYKIEDSLPPIPKKIIISNLGKNSRINGLPKELEMDVTKISETEYSIKDIISVSGEVGISLEAYDKINNHPFNFGIYSIKLEIDDETIFESEYNHINFDEGYKVFCERDYSRYELERQKVYSLYKKNSYPPSSFIKTDLIKKIEFNDRLYHKGKITLSDFNKNEVEINFNLLSAEREELAIIFNKEEKGFTLKSNDNNIESINIYLESESDSNLKYTELDIDSISQANYFVHSSNSPFKIVASEPLYKDGTRGAIQYNYLGDEIKSINGEINLIDSERGVAFEFLENNFSGEIPVLGLTIDEKLYKYPMYRASAKSFISELFYPLELKGLTRVSIFYMDSIVNEFTMDLASDVYINEFPFELSQNDISIHSKGETNKYSSFDDASHNNSFIYIRPYNNPELIENEEIIHGPFIVGPQLVPLKDKFILSYLNKKNYANLGIYKYDYYNNKWKFLDNQLDERSITARIKSGGVFAILKDTKSPTISRMVPKIGSTYRNDHFEMLKFDVKDDLSGIKNEKNIEVLLDGEKIICEYNTYRNTVFYNLKDPLIKGKHKIEISVSDNSDNTKKISGVFYIK